MKHFILGFIFFSYSMMVQAEEPLSIHVNAAQKNFVISLAANATTGYQWSVVQFDKSILTLSSSVYQTPQTKLIGAGGQMLFTFALNKGRSYPRMMHLTFKYARSWEKEGSGSVQQVTVYFDRPER